LIYSSLFIVYCLLLFNSISQARTEPASYARWCWLAAGCPKRKSCTTTKNLRNI
jgi:hypothetical protein